MGNNQPRYFTEKEAMEIIGKHTTERLFQQLNKNGKYVDYNLFSQIISIQFDRMVYSLSLFLLTHSLPPPLTICSLYPLSLA
jgi:hypothetical protein